MKKNLIALSLAVLNILALGKHSQAQITTLGDPTKYIYGLTDNGQIIEINQSTGASNQVIKNSTYSAPLPTSANGLGYDELNGLFYYFKDNSNSASQAFVSFNPASGVLTTLAKSTIESTTLTGAVSYDGKGYYTIDAYGAVSYYNIATNHWTLLTENIIDQYGASVDSLIFNWSSGDIAFDASGNLWIVVSSSNNYAVYKASAPVPTTTVSQLSVTRVIPPTTATPNHNLIGGVAFGSDGTMYMSTFDNKLYYLIGTTLTFRANLATSTEGSDLTSQNFTGGAVPVTWISIGASLENNNNVTLNWKVFEYENDGFYIEHSADGATWSDIAFIKSKNMTTQSEQSYTYTYTAFLSGSQYYRIKQVDIDGNESLSTVKVLDFAVDKPSVVVWPNPAQNSLYIDNNLSISTIATRLKMYDVSGRLNINRKLQQGVNVVDITSLSSGMYMAMITTDNGNILVQKIVKK